jgi:CHASE2 domain-containing sensor protein
MARNKLRAASKREKNKSADVSKTRIATKKSNRRRVIKFLSLLAVVLAFNFFFHRAGLFAEIETKLLDAQMKLSFPETESDVAIVDINQDDFDLIFLSKTRPLNPPILKDLIEKILKANPCVVGVDIDTSFSEFGKLENLAAAKNVVWAREAEISETAGEKPIPLDFLGGRNVETGAESGFPILVEEREKVTRRYSRLIGTTQGNFPSLPWAVFKAGKKLKQSGSPYCQSISFPELTETADQYVIGYSRGAEGAGRTKIPASHILRFDEQSGWQHDNPLRGKIVLVGGTYLDEDRHETPLGKLPGVEIIANVIETELGGGGNKPPDFWRIVLLQIFDGVLLLGLFHYFALKTGIKDARKKAGWREIFPWQPLILSLPAIAVISIICSLITYGTLSHWFLFAPVMLGVIVAELLDRTKDYLKGRYRDEIEETLG